MSAENYRILRSSRTSRVSTLIGLFILIALFAAPWWAGRADLRLLSEVFLLVSLASLWDLLAGYSGLVSVGQQAYMGFDGYVLFALAMFLGVHPLLSVPVVAILGTLVSLPVATLIFRLKGADFAIGTWVVAEVFRLVFAQTTALGGGSGTSLPAGIVKSIAASRSARESATYWIGARDGRSGDCGRMVAAEIPKRAGTHRDPRQ